MDKILLKFIADVLYLKGLLCVEELEAIYDAKTFSDLDTIFEKMIRGEFNAYKRGDGYWRIDNRTDGGDRTNKPDNNTSCKNATLHTPLLDGAVHA